MWTDRLWNKVLAYLLLRRGLPSCVCALWSCIPDLNTPVTIFVLFLVGLSSLTASVHANEPHCVPFSRVYVALNVMIGWLLYAHFRLVSSNVLPVFLISIRFRLLLPFCMLLVFVFVFFGPVCCCFIVRVHYTVEQFSGCR